MALTTARKKANAKYEAKAYDKTLIRLPKGRLDEIRSHIEPAGESLNGFIGRAITETMERDSGGTVRGTSCGLSAGQSVDSPQDTGGGVAVHDTLPMYQGGATAKVVYQIPKTEIAEKPAETAQGAGVVSLPPDTLEAAQRAAETSGETVPAFISRAVVTQAQRDKTALAFGIKPATGGKLEKEA